jgi:hypothetical protein
VLDRVMTAIYLNEMACYPNDLPPWIPLWRRHWIQSRRHTAAD